MHLLPFVILARVVAVLLIVRVSRSCLPLSVSSVARMPILSWYAAQSSWIQLSFSTLFIPSPSIPHKLRRVPYQSFSSGEDPHPVSRKPNVGHSLEMPPPEDFEFLSTLSSRPLYSHSGPVRGLGWNVDGTKLGTGGVDKTMRIWPTASMDASTMVEPVMNLYGHTSAIEQLRWSPIHADLLASSSSDKTLRRWDLRRGISPVSTVNTPGSNINLAWSPDGNTLAIGDSDDLVSFVDIRTNAVIETQKYPLEVNELKWNSAGTRLFVTMGNGRVEVLEWPGRSLVRTLIGHTASCYCLDHDPNHDLLVVGSADGLSTLWDLDEFFCIRAFENSDFPIRSIRFSYDGSLVAAGREGNFLDITEVSSGRQVHRIPVESSTNATDWHPSRFLLAYAGDPSETAVQKLERFAVRVYGFPSASHPESPALPLMTRALHTSQAMV